MRYTGSGNGAAPAGGDRGAGDTYFQGKICSRYVLLEICCASMVRYKVCRLREHRWVGLRRGRMRSPTLVFHVLRYVGLFFLIVTNGTDGI